MPLVLLLVLSCIAAPANANAQDTSHMPQCAADVSEFEDEEAAELCTKMMQKRVVQKSPDPSTHPVTEPRGALIHETRRRSTMKTKNLTDHAKKQALASTRRRSTLKTKNLKDHAKKQALALKSATKTKNLKDHAKGLANGDYVPHGGEAACEMHGYTEDQCHAVGCCHFGDDGECWSDVGTSECDGAACTATLYTGSTVGEGTAYNFTAGDYGFGSTTFPNDAINSVEVVGASCKVTVYAACPVDDPDGFPDAASSDWCKVHGASYPSKVLTAGSNNNGMGIGTNALSYVRIEEEGEGEGAA